MTKIGKRVSKADPLNAPIADQATALPASDRIVGSDDNLPRLSSDAVAAFNDELNQREGFLDRIEKLIEASGRAVANDEETAGRCADLQRQIAAAVKVVEDTRKGVKEPYFEAGRAVDDASKRHSSRLGDALLKVRGLIEGHMRRVLQKQREDEEERQREVIARHREEEERRKDAQAAGEPEPASTHEPEPPRREPEPIQARGDYGSTASAVKVWKGEIEDWSKAFKAVQGNESVREAIQKAINQRIKAGDRTIAGVRIYDDIGVRVR